jgi:hypothetical protein
MDTAYPPRSPTRSPEPVPQRSVPPVSADWDPWYRRLSGTCGLPAQGFSPPASLYIGCPEAALMRAVLEDALTCFQRQCETERRWVQREAREAEEWFFSEDAHGLFSYASVCAVLGLEPETIRQKLMHRSQSHPNLSQRPQRRMNSAATRAMDASMLPDRLARPRGAML